MQKPIPPQSLFDDAENHFGSIRLCPAKDVFGWVRENIISEDGPIYNPDHAHLEDADLCFLWASSGFNKQGRTVLGTCEQVMMRVGGWQKARAEQQLIDWFGHVPDFIITLDAAFCEQCTDLEFCALVEHELYHIAQARDEWGELKFTDEGLPKLKIQAHDVEEFTGVVRRYGPSKEVEEMVKAASSAPEVAKINIARACGTCMLKSA